MEMRGANGGRCRHDTPAQNSLLLQEETEEPFSISSSLFSLPLLKCATIFSLPSASPSLFPPFPPPCFELQSKHRPHPHTYLNDLWPSPKISHLLVCAWNNEEADTHTHTHMQFLPHCASVQPPTGAGGEEALDHSVTELAWWGQAGVQRGAGPLGFSEAHQARGVLKVQHKQTTSEETEQDLKWITFSWAHLMSDVSHCLSYLTHLGEDFYQRWRFLRRKKYALLLNCTFWS